jgi:hypothetical protein
LENSGEENVHLNTLDDCIKVCQSWKKNPNTSSQWAIPHDKNMTSKEIEKEKKRKRKEVKLQCPLCIVEIFDKGFDSKMSHVPCI